MIEKNAQENKILKNTMALVGVIARSGEDPEDIKCDIQSIKRYLEYFPKYFNSVINHVIGCGMARFLYKGEEYRDKVQALDHNRRSCHIAAADAVNKLNRLAKFYDAEQVFEIPRDLDPNNVDDRNIAVEMSYSFCTMTFLDGTQRNSYHTGNTDTDLVRMAEAHCQFHTELPLGDMPSGHSE